MTLYAIYKTPEGLKVTETPDVTSALKSTEPRAELVDVVSKTKLFKTLDKLNAKYERERRDRDAGEYL